MTRALLLTVAAVAALTACQREAEPVPAETPAPPVAAPDPTAPIVPGQGAASFVGRWAADVAWCANPQGDRQPITITTTRFEGYENRCDITRVTETAVSWDADLRCESEGTVNEERVRMTVTDDTLRLDYLTRGGAPVELTRCTTLAQPGAAPAA